MSDTGKIIALAKAVGASPDPAVIQQNVEDWLDDHPEATTTVQDGSITRAKLAAGLEGDLAAAEAKAGELVNDKNDDQSDWQSGAWGSSSDAQIAANARFISYNGYLDGVDTIVNSDTDKYKYGIIAHDLNATYPGKGWYDPTTEKFVMYQQNFITARKFDLAVLRERFPGYSFTVSVRRLTETDMSTSQYRCVGFFSYSTYGKAYIDAVMPKTVYVSAAGSDANTGADANHPVLTISHALDIGAVRVLMAGGNYSEQIDIAKAKRGRVSIEALDPASSPVIYAPGCVVAETESAVSGYTKVYSAATEHEFPSTTSKVFLDGVPDAATAIDDDDRHPLQRGNFYRCGDTMLSRCAATGLNDALAEIEASDGYKWFYNSGTIYFSRPQTVTSEHPLMTGLFDAPLFKNSGTRACSISMSGLVIKYAQVNLNNFSGAAMTDCRVTGGCGGGILYNNALSVTLERCDVSHAYSGTLGDGICATGSNTYGTAYGTTAMIVDCWAHDNNDDGFSDHNGCESTIIGGLYEYNGKGGILPTGGGSCTCYNVESRYNAIGFEIAGTDQTSPVVSGRNGQQMTCFGCLADHNSQYGYFVAGNMDMTMKLVGCRSTNNGVGYYGPYNSPTSDLIAIDCSSYGDTTAKGTNVTVINTQMIE